MIDLRTQYMGLELETPIVVSANPLSQKVDNIAAMQDAGAGAVVLFSLFEEQIRLESARNQRIQQQTSHVFAEAADYFPALTDYAFGTHEYLELIRQAKEKTDFPIIASLNGITPEGWMEYAKEIEQAGADALEMNIFFIPADIRMAPSEVEKRYVEMVQVLRECIQIPIAVKLNPYFSSIGHLATQLGQAGADALVLFNRFYQPDFDIDQLRVVPSLEYSTPSEIRLPLLWTAILYGKLQVSLAASTGIHSANELAKYILAGADVGMVASSLMQKGIPHLSTLVDGLEDYMKSMHFKRIDSFRGAMSQLHVSDPSALERSNYIQILEAKKYR